MITEHIIFYVSLLNPCVINGYVSFQMKWPSARPLHKTKLSVLSLVKAGTNTLFSVLFGSLNSYLHHKISIWIMAFIGWTELQ